MNQTSTLLEISRATLGTPEACAAVESVSARANCVGPKGAYITEIHSARDGRVRFQQTRAQGNPMRVIINPDGAWATDLVSGESDRLDAASVSMIRGHEFQMLPLTLAERYTQPEDAGLQEWNGEMCIPIRARDALGLACTHYFRTRDMRWVGMEQSHPLQAQNKTRVYVHAWTETANVSFPCHVSAVDSGGEYIFHFEEIRVNQAPPEFFLTPSSPAREAHAV